MRPRHEKSRGQRQAVSLQAGWTGDNMATIVSLPHHLRESLRDILPYLPLENQQQIELFLSGDSVPYAVLRDISTWSRTDNGRIAIASHGLDPNAYSSVSLLAGTLTTPSAQLYSPTVLEPSSEARLRLSDRRAITTLINALFSISGVGFATWWAASSAHWRNHWVHRVNRDMVAS